jgi:small-conductance mechanosensitive channel
MVIFGPPQQTPTLLGLFTAGLTFALQDYIIAFLGWFMLMGKTGIHVGDWVEINGVGGEVVEFRLMTTTLLETGALSDPGLPTGRRITFMNSFAIRGQYFNFSTAGQWMWDQIAVTVPDSADIQTLAQRAESVVREETSDNVRLAEQEWRRGNRQGGGSQVNATPVVNLRPSGSNIEMQIRYVTPAASRFEFRNRLYHRVIELLHQHEPEPVAQTKRQLETARDFV